MEREREKRTFIFYLKTKRKGKELNYGFLVTLGLLNKRKLNSLEIMIVFPGNHNFVIRRQQQWFTIGLLWRDWNWSNQNPYTYTHTCHANSKIRRRMIRSKQFFFVSFFLLLGKMSIKFSMWSCFISWGDRLPFKLQMFGLLSLQGALELCLHVSHLTKSLKNVT